LQKSLAASRLDTLIVLGDDQDEAYLEDCRPTFAIYCGESITNGNTQHPLHHQRYPESGCNARGGQRAIGLND